ncbi:hypothetical protein [Actomonas aquatica]|uniref:Cell division protein FtsL n=1 Tax=Actomonas aquatica TaxID=2866162 RepID=A0ABZ1CBT2_9BACT|nr:hypothetical protein [Opitutus sp. WL0086]WRQ89110.1 hypothetical protein K1X11_006795 [Opitutus sp. WL0086]
MNTSTAHAFINKLLIYVLLMIGVNGTVGLGIVWTNHQISASAAATKTAEAQIAAIERRIDETTALLAAELSPEVLEAKNTAMALGLVPPVEDSIVRIYESPEERLAAKRNIEIFSRDVTTPADNRLVRFTLADRS